MFDTGHQAYVHKIADRSARGLRHAAAARRAVRLPESGRERARLVENSHASTALSYADGLAKACKLRGERRPARGRGHRRRRADRRHGLGGAEQHRRPPDRPLVIVVNDNGRSYAPTIGGLADHLATLRTDQRLRAVPGLGPTATLRPHPGASGRPVYETLHGVKKGIKDVVAPQGMFEDLGLKYVGPVDGHDERRRGARAAPGQRLRRPGASCTRSPRRAAATRRPRTTRPTSSTASA